MKKGIAVGTFVFEQKQTEAVESALYQKHIALTGKSHMAAFAGFLMPLWYSSISAEHNAVRKTAGIFDCTHMGVLEVKGQEAEAFLNIIATNDVSRLESGAAQYSYIIDAAGNVLDDIIIYRREKEKFMVVVNAANEPKIKAYIKGLLAGQVIIDADEPNRKPAYKPAVRNMRDTGSGPPKADCRVDIAMQGPASLDVVLNLLKIKKDKEAIRNLKSFRFIETTVDGTDIIISHTGYTGAKVGFEFYVHPNKAGQIWDLVLDAGKKFSVLPCGLGSRDSLRIEAGLPLYGHELDGQFGISPFEAGYGWAVKLQKEFFIGKASMHKRAENYNMEVARIELAGEKGVRPVRQNDAVLNGDGACIGSVLSCAKVGQKQIALIFVSRDNIKEGTDLGIYYLARSCAQVQNGRRESVDRLERLKADIVGKGLSRFARF
jgi:glycine cleavage system T protein